MAYPFYNSYQQQTYGAMPYPPYQPQPVPQSSITWVDSQSEAEAYPMAPNAAIALWDRKQSCIYVKQTDAMGRAMLRILDYTDRSAAQEKQTAQPELATKADLAALTEAVKGLETLLRGDDNVQS